MALAAEAIGDRWTLLILREAFYGVQRYDDMRQDLDAPRSMLSDRLARLVERGILERRAYQEPGDRARHAYVLTPSGRDLALTLAALTQWGEAHVLGRPAPVGLVDRQTGRPLRVALVDEAGRAVDAAAARLVRRPE
ncbi:winged helix-turn-helix transcriptional regulator [Phreatobacter sp.]|uniref:winged helix-turn-helix transcriptional regulator n=1 Tax=Phreatobacter sp. TaxID=1966341 RepID=UPI003F71E2A0